MLAVHTRMAKAICEAKKKRWSRGVNTACSWQRCNREHTLITDHHSFPPTDPFVSCFGRRTTRGSDEKHSLTASPKASAAKPLYGSASSPWASAAAGSSQTIVSTTVKEPSPNSPQMQPRPTAAQVARAQTGSPGSPMRRAFAPPVSACKQQTDSSAYS